MRGILSALARGHGRLPVPGGVFGVSLVLAFISIASVGAARLYDYTQNDPGFCGSCHTMEQAWDRWRLSAHSAVRCDQCHQQSARASMGQVVRYAMRDQRKVSKHAAVSDEACAKCHASNDSGWLQIGATAGHRTHVEGQGISCTSCHSLTLHRFESPKQSCGTCHSERQIKIPEMASLHCLTCHDFHASQTDLLPDRDRCLTCHLAMPQVKVTWPPNAPMKWKCGACHKPHEQLKPSVDCASCHQRSKLEGLHTQASHTAATCQSCHIPHEWRVIKGDPCFVCHSNKAQHGGDLLCSRCHSFEGRPR